jgi:NAD(P)-dependent dehydrogenase (short-subunit alcohol dehydrogenase family)
VRLVGTTALVTGASGDLGHAIASHLLDLGAGVIAHSRTGDLGQLRDRGADVRHADLTDPAAVARFVADLSQEFERLDLLVNNAGGGQPRSWRELTLLEWADNLALNLTAPFLLSQGLLPLLTRSTGSIVNVTSVAALTGGAFGPHYAASKAGLIGLTRSAAREFGPLGVRVNALAPGPVASTMTGSLPSTVLDSILATTALGRVVRPHEIAEAVVYLATATAVTGQVLVVDAGRHFY